MKPRSSYSKTAFILLFSVFLVAAVTKAKSSLPDITLEQAKEINADNTVIFLFRHGERCDRFFYKMQQAVPDKELLEAPTAGEGATCRSCAHCPWMAMNGLQSIAEALEQEGSNHEVHVDERPW